jgi:hypothetical protein
MHAATSIPPARRFAFAALAVVSAIAVALAIAEAAARFLYPPPEYHGVYAPDEVLHHRARPRATGGQRLETGRAVMLRTNSLGLRGLEIPPKAPGVCRIVDVGDSFIEAGTSPEPDTSAKVLERLLNDRRDGRRYEVVNAGQVSHSPILYTLFLERVLLALAPDLVLVNVDMSDVQDDAAYSRIAEFDAAGRPRRVPNRPVPALAPPPSPPPPWRAWLSRRFALVRWFEYRTGRSFTAATAIIVPGDIESDRLGTTRDEGVAWDEHYRRTGGYLVGIRDLLAARGVPLMIFAYPLGHQVAPREWDRGRRMQGFERGRVYTGTFFPFLETFCRARGLPCHLLLEPFRAYRGEERLYLRTNGHFTAAGERLLAHSQFDALVADGTLDRACAR